MVHKLLFELLVNQTLKLVPAAQPVWQHAVLQPAARKQAETVASMSTDRVEEAAATKADLQVLKAGAEG